MLFSLMQTRKLYVCVYISILRGSHGASLVVWWGSRWQLICVSTWPAKTSSLGLCQVSLDGRSTWLVGSAVSLPSVGLHLVHWRSEKKSWRQEECPSSPLVLSWDLSVSLSPSHRGSHQQPLVLTPLDTDWNTHEHCRASSWPVTAPQPLDPGADSSQPASRCGPLPCSSEPWASTEKECRCAGEETGVPSGKMKPGSGSHPCLLSPHTETHTQTPCWVAVADETYTCVCIQERKLIQHVGYTSMVLYTMHYVWSHLNLL